MEIWTNGYALDLEFKSGDGDGIGLVAGYSNSDGGVGEEVDQW